MHAKGSGAYGTFTVTKDVTHLTRAKAFSAVGKQTPTFVRFSTVAGERGAADAERDIRGFAVKFYTEEGNWDIVGNNTPVFFFRDPLRFPDLNHAVKRDPRTGMRSPDNNWDFWTSLPEALHQVTIVMSDRGIPKSYRTMHGFGSHTFSWINQQGERVWIKFHFVSQQGIENLSDQEAAAVVGRDRESHQRDLFESIEAGAFPSWKLCVQVMTNAQAKQHRHNPFDLTKIWPKGEYPLHEVGVLTLDRNPENVFAEVEQAAFSPANVVPGVGFSPDKMLQARLFSYGDAQRYRLGVNFNQIPVNAPRCPFHSFHRDGAMRVDGNLGRTAAYYPNRHGEWLDDPAAREPALELEGAADHFDHRVDEDHYEQPGDLFRLMTSSQREALFGNTARSLGGATRSVQARHVVNCSKADPEYGAGVARALELVSKFARDGRPLAQRPSRLTAPASRHVSCSRGRMDLHLSGKVAVVTGASKGIGLATAKAFAEEGALVVAGARRMSKVASVAGITAVDVDLAEPSGPATLVEKAISQHGRIDVLVNNVGAVKLRLGGFLETSDEEFEWAMKMNFFTALRDFSGRRGAHARAEKWFDRERHLGQRLLPARRRYDRLRRREGGASQPQQDARPAVRPARDPRERGFSRPSDDRPLVRTERCRGHGLEGHGAFPRRRPRSRGDEHRWFRDPAIHHSRRSRCLDRHARVRSRGERHGLEFRDRRRPTEDSLNPERTPARKGRTQRGSALLPGNVYRSAFHEAEDLFVEAIALRDREPVVGTRVDLQGRALHQLGRHFCRSHERDDLIVVAVNEERRNVDFLEIFGKVGLREGLDALEGAPKSDLHALQPELGRHPFGNLRSRAIHPVERRGEVLVELGTVRRNSCADRVEGRDRKARRVRSGFQHQGRHRADQHGFLHALRPVAPEVARHLASARRVTDHDRVFQIELIHEAREVVRVRVHFIAVPGLTRTAVTAAIVGDGAKPARRKVDELLVPGVGVQRPAVAEDDGLTRAPVLVEDVGAVLSGDRAHERSPLHQSCLERRKRAIGGISGSRSRTTDDPPRLLFNSGRSRALAPAHDP